MMVDLIDVNLFFGDRHILKNINISIEKGKTLAIIGTSGAGKSTILKCICGIVMPRSGQIIFDGQDILLLNEKELRIVRKRIGMVFQYSALFDYLNVFENVAFGLRKNTNMTESEIHQIVIDKLTKVNLSHSVELFPNELSGGMKKRVALARSLVMEPDLLLYDEPTSGLDPITTAATNNLINMGKEMGMTSIVVTHDIPTINSVADKVAFIHDGSIIYFGNYQDMIVSDNPYVIQFMNGLTEGPIATIG